MRERAETWILAVNPSGEHEIVLRMSGFCRVWWFLEMGFG